MRAALAIVLALFAWSCGSDGEDSSDAPSCSLNCGLHEICENTACVCAPGYTGNPCEWGTVPGDPEFMRDDVWSDESPGVTIRPSRSGLNSGVVEFTETAVCNGGVVAQTVQMPTIESAQPLVLEMTYRGKLLYGVDVYTGRSLRTLQGGTVDWFAGRWCLGAGAYGSPANKAGSDVEFRVAAAERDNSCESDPGDLGLEIDRFQIVPAQPGECPEPGTALNGGAEPTQGGWSFDLVGVDRDLGGAALEPGVGRGESGGARLFLREGGTGVPIMGTTVSVPMASEAGGPELTFAWKSSEGFFFQSQFGPLAGTAVFNPIAPRDGDGEWHTETYCLPPWTHGSVVELWFNPLSVGNLGELVVDDVAVSVSARCGSSTELLDPVFDSGPGSWAGVIARAPGLEDPIRIIDPADDGSPSGGGALSMRYASSDSRLTLHHWVWVPPSEGDEGPEVAFWAKQPTANARESLLPVYGIVSRSLLVVELDQLQPTVGWERVGFCLPPELSNRWARFRVEIFGGPADPSGPRTFDPPKELLLDDFEVTTSPGCRAQ
ncbi:MAG: calcium-binding EGF-like domain-containing protein [Myxococcota bacterium]